MRIHIVRHTAPDIARGICYGQLDVDVADTFELEQQVVKDKLDAEFDVVYCSPLKRCQLLANKLQSKSFETNPELKEVNFGRWEGQAWDDIPRAESQPWMDNYIELAPPGGESLLEMQERVLRFVEEKLLASDLESVAIVTHAGVMRLMLAWALSIPLNKVFNVKLGYGAVIEMTYNKGSKGATVKFL